MRHPHVATFSIVARDKKNGDLGVAVASKFLGAGAVVPWAKAGAGAVATQALANMSFGPRGIALLEAGTPAEDALRALLADDPEREHRQVGIVDASGRAAAHTGSECLQHAGHTTGEGFAAQGNLIAGQAVVSAMATAFEKAEGELAERLVAAIRAGDAAGGDRRGRQSAALYVARAGGSYGGTTDRYIDLRVDDHPSPIPELTRLLRMHRFFLSPSGREAAIPIDERVAAELRSLLRRAGYFKGADGGAYDEATRAALAAYAGVENLEERILPGAEIDPEVLRFLREKIGDEPG